MRQPVADARVGVRIERWRTTLWLSAATSSRTENTDSLKARLSVMLDEEVDQLERAASRFRLDSELAALNRSPNRWRDVSPVLADVVAAALHAAAATDGLTNPCLGADVDRAGYRSWRDGTPPVTGESGGARVQPAQDTDAREMWRSVELVQGLGGARMRIGSGYQLDLGAVAKGWLADRLAERVARELDRPALANMGGDLRATGGMEWTVGLDPQVPGMQSTTFAIVDSGLATSSQARRRWVTPDGPGHHLIDPRTSRAADTPWWSVSVLAASAADANAAATASMVLGHGAADWLRDTGLDAVLVAYSPGATPVTYRVGRWPSLAEVA